ncbi:MAG: DEAD/DEAH box helicase family protein, partial [Spirochaetales bacterium]|nr:DEAD/DEAH box helicase family protein [Spirochaetales bacterium]
LADQAFNAFNAFPEDALVRIAPDAIRKKGRVPTNGNIFFTIFQTFMSGRNENGDPAPNFGEYPRDYFDFIIIDECHRGGANDESNWRGIMEYFSPAVQLGLTATPKRKNNADTYAYFGEPVYIYSLKEGINDGFLTPFKVKRVQTTIDEYIYTSDDTVIEGEVEEGRVYGEEDFNRIIQIKEREEKRAKIILDEINQKEKTLVFCANQEHALAIRDLINQYKKSSNPNYCHRVTANDGKLGEQHLRDFQDNEKSIPTILTTSQKLSTGVDARNIRNIVLLRPVNSMIEFKQIIGRGTRLFEGKDYFTLYDYVGAYHHFLDPEWDGEPLDPEPYSPSEPKDPLSVKEDPGDPEEPEETKRPKKLKIKLRDGKEREIQHMIATSFWSADGKPISAEEFLQNLFGKLPDFFKDEDELRKIWSVPSTRKALLESLKESGYGKDELSILQKLVNAENSDIFDVLEYVSFAVKPITREERVAKARPFIFDGLNKDQRDFLEFVLSKYIETGVDELDQEKLPDLLSLKYYSITDAAAKLGGIEEIKETFIAFQRYLYANPAA